MQRSPAAPARALPIPRTQAKYAARLEAAVAAGPLSRFPRAARADLIGRGVRLDARARTVMYREGDAPFSAVLVQGVLRLFVAAEDGREFTLLWAHPGDWLGASLVAGGAMDICAQALTDASLHVISVDVLESLARADAAVAWEFARQLAERVRQATALVRMLAFMDLRQRIAQRLLELGFRGPVGGPLVARVTQQELADAVGSPRTSVARVLADLRAEGIVRSVPGGIEIVRPEQIAAAAPR